MNIISSSYKVTPTGNRDMFREPHRIVFFGGSYARRVVQHLSQGKANSNSKISKVKCQLTTLGFGRIEALLYSTSACASVGSLNLWFFLINTYDG